MLPRPTRCRRTMPGNKEFFLKSCCVARIIFPAGRVRSSHSLAPARPPRTDREQEQVAHPCKKQTNGPVPQFHRRVVLDLKNCSLARPSVFIGSPPYSVDLFATTRAGFDSDWGDVGGFCRQRALYQRPPRPRRGPSSRGTVNVITEEAFSQQCDDSSVTSCCVLLVMTGPSGDTLVPPRRKASQDYRHPTNDQPTNMNDDGEGREGGCLRGRVRDRLRCLLVHIFFFKAFVHTRGGSRILGLKVDLVGFNQAGAFPPL